MAIVISNIKTTPVVVPFRHPPVTASGAIGELPLVLLDVETDVGLTGHAYLVVFLTFLQCMRLIIYFSSKYKKST